MRDPNRIAPLLKKLAEAWSKWPDQRFGQFVYNFFGACQIDPFYIEDDYWEIALQAYINGKDPKEAILNYRNKKYGG